MAALTLVWGCTSDDDSGNEVSQYKATFTSVQEAPDWSVDFYSNDPKPSWTPIDNSEFESSMVIVAKLQKELVPFSTDDDVMAVFINNSCHTIAPRNIDIYNGENIYFVLNVYGTPTDNTSGVTLSYYSGGLHQLFTVSQENMVFLNEFTIGTDKDFIPHMLYGTSKYPIINHIFVETPDNPPFNVSDDDIVAVFVGNECRGVNKVGNPITVYRYNADEQVYVRYYSSEKQGIYTSPQTVKPVSSATDYIINF